MPAPTRPHISTALQHLRLGVSASGAVLCIALVAQVIVWGCVHFMDLRTQRLGPDSPSALVVVNKTSAEPADEETPTPEEPTASGAGKSLISAPARAPGKSAGAPSRAAAKETRGAGAEVNTVGTGSGLVLMRTAELVQTVGIVAALTMALLMFQGVLIGAGVNAPGIQFAVTASSWAVVIALLCVPLNSLLPGAAFGGVFRSYRTMADMVDAYRAGAADALGGPAYYGTFLILPFTVALAAAAAVLRFRAGIEEGVIITSVSQLDDKIEREIRTNKWGALSSPRAMGALNRAIGDAPEMPGHHRHGAPMPVGSQPSGDESGASPLPGSALRRPI